MFASNRNRSYLSPRQAHQMYGPVRYYAPGYRQVYGSRKTSIPDIEIEPAQSTTQASPRRSSSAA